MTDTHKTWFITGASSGLGEAFARYAVDEGYNVVATARSMAKLEALAEIAPDRVLALRLDVTVADDAEAAVAAAIARFGSIDVLINNAGYAVIGALEETPDAEWRAQMETNFFGAIHVIRAVLPVMRAQGAGAIANISSNGGQLSFAGFGAYSASKFALEGMSEALAAEVAHLGIKVTIVEPGQFRTNLVGNDMRRMPEMPDYADSVGPIRDFADGMNGTQFGDPYKAARAIDLAIRADVTPLRLQLGGDAIDTIRAHSEQMLADIARWEAVGRDTLMAS
ncbi:oxidoreductase [Erythrobacter sp.]|uniref:oxidoreductase n=1 Tax=Erythrobacter sp. TaxID=1042 RepID=UPI0025D1CCCC|nr:oxidoreductase [Erythrobacter sp.]